MGGLFDFTDYGALLGLVTDSLIAAAVLGIVGGLVGVFVQIRDMQFAVHGISELSFAGASAALLLGVNVAAGSIVGSLLAGALIGGLGVRARDRNSVIGVLMPFGLGLGVLFLSLYQGRAANKFGLLTGQIVAVDTVQLNWLIGVGVAVVVGLAVIWRPLLFVSADPEVAVARGVPAGRLSLVLALLVTPAAAAFRVTASPLLAPLLSVAFAVVSAVGGILLALGSSVPISPFVTTISFVIYLACRLLGRRRRSGRLPRAGQEQDVDSAAVDAGHENGRGSVVVVAASPGERAR
jgi:zinc/manganese transport system permease protein